LPYYDVNLRYRLGSRTAVSFTLSRDQNFSAFQALSGSQTSKQLASELAMGRRLWGPVDIRLFGGLRQFETDGGVDLGGAEAPAVREDEEWFGGANLGFRLRNWFRIGVEARYSDRDSTFEDFGVDGLLVGVTVSATPGDIVDLMAPN
jgi:hypothetical protein